MKRRTLLLAGIAAVFVSSHGNAQFVCANCSDLVNQLLEYAMQAKQYATQLQSYVTQLQQFQNMIQNTLALPMQLYQQVQNVMWQVQSATQLGSLLSGNSGSIIQRLSSLGSYTNQAEALSTNLANLPQQFTTWQNQLGNSFSTLGKTLGLQQSDLQSQASFQQAVQQQASGASGQMQAIQASVQMAASNGAILHQIEQTLIATAQANSQYQEVQADKQALRDAATLQGTQWTDEPLTGAQAW